MVADRHLKVELAAKFGRVPWLLLLRTFHCDTYITAVVVVYFAMVGCRKGMGFIYERKAFY
jgi:hypothetical protein